MRRPRPPHTVPSPTTRVRHAGTGAALLVACAASACAGAARTETGDAARPPADSIAQLEAIYEARRDSARLDFSPADVRFMTDMIAHHAQAVVMSRLAPTRGADPGVQTAAARIINAQLDEIATMQDWLRQRGQPAPAPDLEGTHAHGHGGGHAGVPGMLTPEQLDELARARGAEFDRLFLTYMIEHHRGAVIMVQELFATDGGAQGASVFKLASDIQADQTVEIERMELMLAERSAGDEQ